MKNEKYCIDNIMYWSVSHTVNKDNTLSSTKVFYQFNYNFLLFFLILRFYQGGKVFNNQIYRAYDIYQISRQFYLFDRLNLAQNRHY